MEKTRIRFMRCPYCSKTKVGSHGKTKNKKVGLFYVKELYNNVLIFECQLCLKVCRRSTIGKTLEWADMTPEDKKAFNKRKFVEYKKKTKLQEVKNE